MNRDDRLRIAQATLSDTHRKLHNLQSETMIELRHTVTAMRGGLGATRDSIRATREVIEAAMRASESAERAADRAEVALKATTKTLELVNEAHDAMIALYEQDGALEAAINGEDTDTP